MTGATFARGSCRALKWMALVGMVFALGAGQAAAQTAGDTVATYSGTTVTLNLMDSTPAEVKVQLSDAGPLALSAWTVTEHNSNSQPVTGTSLTGLAVASATIPALGAGASATIMLTLNQAIPSGTVLELDYTAPATGTKLVTEGLVDVGTMTDIEALEAESVPTFTTTPPALTFLKGQTVKMSLVGATGGNGIVSYTLTPLPAGLTFMDNPTATPPMVRELAGMPTTVGTTTAVYTATDRDRENPVTAVGQAISSPVVITVLDTLSLAGPTAMKLTVGTAVPATTAALPAAMGGNPPYTYSVQNLPAGLAFDPATRKLSGTPTTVESRTVVYMAKDTPLSGETMGRTATATFMVDVAAAPSGGILEFSPISVPTIPALTVDMPMAGVTLPEAMGGTTPYMYSITPALPMGLTFNDTTRMLSGTPTTAAPAATFTYKAMDGATPPASGELEFMITVNAATTTALAFASQQADLTLTAGAAMTATALPVAMGGTGPYTYSTTVLPAGLSFDPATRMLSGTPTTAAAATAVEYTATDTATTAATVSQTFNITVTAAATTPTDGIITAIRVGTDTTAPERTVGGVARVHVDEGTTIDVNVTVEWNHAQVTELWDGHTATSPPEPAMVQLAVAPFTPATDAAGAAWLSPAEAGTDALLQSATVSIAIPKKPTATQEPTAENRFKPATGKTVLSLAHDADAEDEGFRVDVVPNTGVFVSTSASRGRTTTDRVNVIVDDETQGIKLSRDPASTAAIFEGDTVTLKAVASPARVNLPLDVRYSVTDLDGVAVSSRLYTLDGGTGEIPVGTGAAAKDTVKFSTPRNDGNRVDNDFTIHADVQSFDLVSGAFDDIAESTVDISVLDLHRLPVVSISPMEETAKEGETVELELTLDRNPPRDRARRSGSEKVDVTSESVTVMLSAGAGSTAGMDDYMLPAAVTFAKHNGKAPWLQAATVEVMVREDQELDAGEVLMLDAMVAGTVPANGAEKSSQEGLAMLTIEEGTDTLVWALEESVVMEAVYDAIEAGAGEDGILTVGETIELEGNDVFGAAPGVTPDYSADSSNNDVAVASDSRGMVTVTAMSEGMAEITVTAHASSPSGVKILDQTDPGTAMIKFPVEVGLEALAIVLSGPTEMNVVEGGAGAMVTATANRPVTEAVTVNLMRDRSMSTASDADFMAEAITIAAGMSSGTTMVTAVEDMTAEDGEELVLYGMAADNAGEVTGEVKLYLWDAAVPALPIIAQLLLAALMAIGGYRRYRRR